MRRALLVLLLLPFVSYLIWDQVETRALRRDIAAIAARGEPTTAEEPAAGADTPERHDAARIYAAAAERARAMPSELTLNLWTRDVDAPVPRPLDELESQYRPDAPVLQLADQAAPLDFNGFGDVEVESQPTLALVGALADLRADLYSARGKGEEAARSLVSSARLQRAITDSNYRRISLVRLLGSVRIMLRHTSPSEASLASLQQAVGGLPDTDTLVHDVQRLRAQMIEEWSAPRASVSEAVLLRIMRPWVARSQRAQLAAFEESMAVAREPWPGRVASAGALARKYEPQLRAMSARPGFFARLTTPYRRPAVAPITITHAGHYLAARRIILAALGVERYRRAHGHAVPESLSALVPAYLPSVPVDPYSGASLVFRHAADHYLVYSVDADAKDDGGALYGVGSKGQLNPLRGTPRDLGIRVEIGK